MGPGYGGGHGQDPHGHSSWHHDQSLCPEEQVPQRGPPLTLLSPAPPFRWLAANLELLGNGLVFAAATCAVLSKAHLSAGLVGFSVSAALQVLLTPHLTSEEQAEQRQTDPCKGALQGPKSQLPTSGEKKLLQELSGADLAGP